jgi:hypothetical protein
MFSIRQNQFLGLRVEELLPVAHRMRPDSELFVPGLSVENRNHANQQWT